MADCTAETVLELDTKDEDGLAVELDCVTAKLAKEYSSN